MVGLQGLDQQMNLKGEIMKRILPCGLVVAFALLCAFSAFADTAVTPLPTAGTWTLIRGSTGAVGWNFASSASCYAAAAKNAETLKSGSSYVCRQDLAFSVTYTPPAPAPQTQTVACVAPAVGSWVQNAVYTLVSGKWVTTWSPAAAPAGACVVPLVFTRIVNEGEAFTVTTGSTVRFGQDTRWVQKAISGASSCTNAVFGSDPAPGTYKQCEVANGSMVAAPVTPTPTPTPVPVDPAPTPVTPPASGTDTVWIKIANEGENRVSYTGQVRYGWGDQWDYKNVTSGVFGCNGYFMNEPGAGGSQHDPAPGFTKQCDRQVTAPHVAQVGLMPVANPAFLTPPPVVAAGPRLGGTAGGSSGAVLNQDTGAMREPSAFSHFAYDDPIVFPGQPGKSHLHIFFGNPDVDAATTADSLMKATSSTSAGGTLNRTGYWTPALIDIRTGKPWIPQAEMTLFYYKCGYLGVKCADIKPFPAGLRIIAGTSSFTTEVNQPGVIRIWCEHGDGTIRNRIPSCNKGEQLAFEVIFPQCWDGVNLDSPNHKSHMAYASNGCPATHPVPLTEISMNLKYVVEESGTDQYLRLSSDNYAGPGGYSMHADWMNGWDVPTMNTWVKNCINPMSDCHSALMGNGQWLY
jgi:hypothetical protein